MAGQSRARRALGAAAALLIAFQFLSLFVAGWPLASGTPARLDAPGNASFERVWARTDWPIVAGLVGRTWIWGPAANTPVLREPYAESPGGFRDVQYFDKSRMEITQPDGDQTSLWHVTNGLLVVELVSGEIQTGDSRFASWAPAEVNVAGDPDDPAGPTYATFGPLRGLPPRSDGAVITERLARDGARVTDPALAAHGVTAAMRVTVPGIDHQVASVFLAFMRSTGPVLVDGALTTDRLFESDFYATGLPIAEAYWANVRVGGLPRDVLIQCFERRCLTWTPANPPAWQVEAGNVGQHYRLWRSGWEAANTATPTATATGTAPTGDGTPTGTAATTATSAPGCDPSYPDFCVPPPPPDLSCNSAPVAGHLNFTVLPPDPHGFDQDGDGVGCESNSAPTATATTPGGPGQPTPTATATFTATSTTTSTPSATQTGTATATATATPSVPWFPSDDQVRSVGPGEDIEPGVYRNTPTGEQCHWKRLSAPNHGAQSSIIEQHVSGQLQTVTILPSDAYFWSEDCGSWTWLSDPPPPTATPTATATATATFTPTATPTPSNFDPAECLDANEADLLTLINDHRADHGLAPLAVAVQLNVAAYTHSLDMATRNYLSHDTQLPLPPGQSGPTYEHRIADTGYSGYTLLAEVIGGGPTTAQAMFDIWADWAPDNTVLLDPQLTQIGIGGVPGGGTYPFYWTVTFGNGNGAPPSGC